MADENSFYKCLSMYLYENEEHYARIQKEIAKYLNISAEEDDDTCEAVLLESYGDRRRSRSHVRSPGDKAVVQAAADLYGVDMYLTTFGIRGIEGRRNVISRTVAYSEQVNVSRWIHLGFQDANYYLHEDWTTSDIPPRGTFSDLRKTHGTEPYDTSCCALDPRKKELDTDSREQMFLSYQPSRQERICKGRFPQIGQFRALWQCLHWMREAGSANMINSEGDHIYPSAKVTVLLHLHQEYLGLCSVDVTCTHNG